MEKKNGHFVFSKVISHEACGTQVKNRRATDFFTVRLPHFKGSKATRSARVILPLQLLPAQSDKCCAGKTAAAANEVHLNVQYFQSFRNKQTRTLFTTASGYAPETPALFGQRIE
ncbi:hypothetical protein CDAR_558141 [Caerostris darwini]|uniref:Uncharacterized protein n=1 Tax=Caerostris darwini TaxID=1538125 RepID=A0AAV4R6V2_9ARAC|nr:hypothetical protein CDAR_558141 [Caerostris darwini]